MTPVWYIHGAFASSQSFNWIKDQLGEHESAHLNYTCTRSFSTVLSAMEERVMEAGEIDIVGHSLGGVFGAILANRCPNVRRVATLASPFGGSRVAALLQFITPGTFMRELQPLSPVMIEARKTPRTPVLSVVTTGGSSLAMMERNDGVVTYHSQRSLVGATYVDRPVNHFEILLDPVTVELLRDFLSSNLVDQK